MCTTLRDLIVVQKEMSMVRIFNPAIEKESIKPKNILENKNYSERRFPFQENQLRVARHAVAHQSHGMNVLILLQD